MAILRQPDQHYQRCSPKRGQSTESFGKSDSVSKLLRGVFKLRPSIPKHVVVYDPDSILNHMISLPGNKQLDLEILTKKLVTLLALLSGQRAQTNLNWHHTTGDQHTFYISKILKTTKPGKHQQPLQFESFHKNEKICVVRCINEYLNRTSLLRENLEGQPKQMILSYSYPHAPVTTQTIARYVKQFLGMAVLHTPQEVPRPVKQITWDWP